MRETARRHTLSTLRTRAGLSILGVLSILCAVGFDAFVLSPIAPPGPEALGRLFEMMCLLWMGWGLWLVAPSFEDTPHSDTNVFGTLAISPKTHILGVFISSSLWLFGGLLVCAWPWVWLGWHGAGALQHLGLSILGVWLASICATSLGLLLGAWRGAQSIWWWGAGVLVVMTQAGRLADWTGWEGLHAWDVSRRYLVPWGEGRLVPGSIVALLGACLCGLLGATLIANVTRWGGTAPRSAWHRVVGRLGAALTSLILLVSAASTLPTWDATWSQAVAASNSTRSLACDDLRAVLFVRAQDPNRDRIQAYFQGWADVEVYDQRFAPGVARRMRARKNQVLVLSCGTRGRQQVSTKDLRRLDVKVHRALSVLARGSEPTFFVEGLGGLEAASASARRSRSGFVRLLRDGLAMSPTSLTPTTSAPTGTLVSILGPTLPISRARAAALENHVREGGTLLLAMEPLYDGNQERMAPVHRSFEGLLRTLGVRIPRGVVRAEDGGYACVSNEAAVHLATTAWRERGLFSMWEGTGRLERVVSGDGSAVPLVYGPERATLLMASTLGKGRALIAADATWLSTLALEQQPGNVALATSALTWALARDIPGITAQVHEVRRVPPRRSWPWVVVTWLMLPLGLGLWGRRVRR